MKKIILILMSLLLSFQANALWRESNGGNGIASEASLIAQDLINEILQVPVLKNYYIERPYTIEVEKNLKLDNKTVDAYTFSDIILHTNTIYINSDKWNNLNDIQKRLLMLHEITHFMYRIDSNYESSQFALKKLNQLNELKKKYPTASIDHELVDNIRNCNLGQFVRTYTLILDLNYLVKLKKQTIEQIIKTSSCEEIKNYSNRYL